MSDPRRASPELIAAMRKMLTSASDDDLDAFLGNHAAATIAELLIAMLPLPARVAFFASMRMKYPAEAGSAGIA